MYLPNATATLPLKVASDDYEFFQRDLTDPTGRRRGPSQTSNVFTRDWEGNLFKTGQLYGFCASSLKIGDDALVGFFNAAGQAIVYTGQPINDPANLSPAEQDLLTPAGLSLPLWAQIGRVMRVKPHLKNFSDDFSDDFD